MNRTVRLLPSRAVLAALSLAGCHRAGPPPEASGPQVSGNTIAYAPNAPEIASLVIAPARRQTIAVSHLTGRLYWDDDNTVRIYSPVSGRVAAVEADLGQSVAANAALAKIDSPDFGQARADARSAASNLAAADKARVREEDLLAHGAAAQKDVEAAEAAYQAALAERDRTVSKMKLWGGNGEGSDEIYVLRTPLAGVVVSRNLTPGQEVRSDQMLANANNLVAPFFVVSDPRRLWLSVDVPQGELATIAPGEKLVIRTPAFSRRTFGGRIANVGLSLDPSTRTAQVRGVVENPDQLLRAEMYVDVDVVAGGAGRRAPLEISSKALFTLGGKTFLFVATAPGRFERREVAVGNEQDGRVPIFGGVAEGEHVVVEGALLLEAVLEPGD